MPSPQRRTRVLIVDDSAIVRRVLSDALRSEPDIEVVGVAADPFVARELILARDPDVLTLDLEMPRMDGLTFLRKLMVHHPLPVIIVSSVTQAGSRATIEALAAGAVDVIAKPGGPQSVRDIAEKLKRRIRAIRIAAPLRFDAMRAVADTGTAAAPLAHLNGLVLIGASAGGPQAIQSVVTRLPDDCPPVLIVQHMPPPFTRAFAARLDSESAMTVVEAQDGERLQRGMAYVAPGDFHLVVRATGTILRIGLEHGAAVHYQRPAVDILFYSAARLRGVPIVALLLTGMGADGADGMLALRKAGATTIAQDEQSCVVFGMPAEAIERGAATHVAPLLRMPQLIAQALVGSQAGDRRVS